METVNLSAEEAVALASHSLVAFGQIFFPKTLRQVSPQFHHEMSHLMLDQSSRLLAFEVFRGSAKTTIARLGPMHRACYAVGNTGMAVGLSQAHSIRTVRWIKKQIEYNTLLVQTFKLRKGSKWTDEWIEIVNERFGISYNLVAMGITGNIRGLNIDDYRPDYIMVDDPCDEENTATPEQRAKTDEAIFSGLVNSLAPKSEAPLSQLVLLQTPINGEDVISKAKRDPTFRCVSYGCFDEAGESRWPARWSTDELIAQKQGFIGRNQLSLWMREMECKIVDSSLAAFRAQWLVMWDVLPDDMDFLLVVDPASSEAKGADDSAVGVLGFWKDEIYLVDYTAATGMMPDAITNKLFEYSLEYKTRNVVIETVAYQKILAWYVEKESASRRYYLNVMKFDDKRKKSDRIVQAFVSIAPYGKFKTHPSHQKFIEQFTSYSETYRGKVDVLDMVAIGISSKKGRQFSDAAIEGEYRKLQEEDDNIPEPEFQSCP